MRSTSNPAKEGSQSLLAAQYWGIVFRCGLAFRECLASSCMRFSFTGSQQQCSPMAGLPRWRYSPGHRAHFVKRGLSIHPVPGILISHLVDSPFPRASTIEEVVLIYYVMLSSIAGVKWCFVYLTRRSASYSLKMIFSQLSAAELSSQLSPAGCSSFCFLITARLTCSNQLAPTVPSEQGGPERPQGNVLKELPFSPLIAFLLFDMLVMPGHGQCFVKQVEDIVGAAQCHVGEGYASRAWRTWIPAPDTYQHCDLEHIA